MRTRLWVILLAVGFYLVFLFTFITRGNDMIHNYKCSTDASCYEECVQVGGKECE